MNRRRNSEDYETPLDELFEERPRSRFDIEFESFAEERKRYEGDIKGTPLARRKPPKVTDE